MTNTEEIAPEAPSPERPTKGTGRRWMGIVAGGVVLIAIGAAAALVLSSGGSAGPARPARYDIQINNGWPQKENEKRVGGYLESAWHDPVGPTIAIDSRLDESGSPMANAELARLQAYQLPGYRERGLKRIKLGHQPAVQWAFDTSKDEGGAEFFFEKCGTSFIVRGSMGTTSFEAYADAFREMASTIKVNCNE
jgi:hypothetical protein